MNFTKIASLIFASIFCAFSTQANGMNRPNARTFRNQAREIRRAEQILNLKKSECLEQLAALKALREDRSPDNLLRIKRESQKIYSTCADSKIKADALALITAVDSYPLLNFEQKPTPDMPASTFLFVSHTPHHLKNNIE